MHSEPYYMAYEKRYRAVFEAGADRWGHSPDDEVLCTALAEWVEINGLRGKRIIEFACGEGTCGVILSKLGCVYHGVDVSPTVVEKAREALADCENASVKVGDMVKDSITEKYDAALDCMGFHMLVTDCDREAYLKNACSALKEGAPMLFFRQSYRNADHSEAVYKGRIESIEEWVLKTGSDYTTPSVRRANFGDGEVEVVIPLVPARANDREGYITEMENAGFTLEDFVEMEPSSAVQFSASIYVRKI